MRIELRVPWEAYQYHKDDPTIPERITSLIDNGEIEDATGEWIPIEEGDWIVVAFPGKLQGISVWKNGAFHTEFRGVQG